MRGVPDRAGRPPAQAVIADSPGFRDEILRGEFHDGFSGDLRDDSDEDNNPGPRSGASSVTTSVTYMGADIITPREAAT